MRKISITFILLLLWGLSGCAGAEIKTSESAAAAPKAGHFTLPDQNGKLWTLGEVLKYHRAVVLAFYPKDDTGA